MSNKNWKNNHIQYPRFIAEAEAAGAFTTKVIDAMATSMDLEVADVVELIDRAQADWDKIKAKTLPPICKSKYRMEHNR